MPVTVLGMKNAILAEYNLAGIKGIDAVTKSAIENRAELLARAIVKYMESSPPVSTTAATTSYVDTTSGSIGNALNHQVLELYDYVDTTSGSIGQDLNHQILDARAYTDQQVQASDTLDEVVKNDSYTDHGIQVDTSGSAFHSLTVASGSIDMADHTIVNTSDPVNSQDAATKAYVDQNFTAMKEPTGFADRTDSSINFTDATRVLEIKDTFDYYIKGTKYSISGSSAEIEDTEGVWYFYLDSSGILNRTQTFVEADIYHNNAYTAVVYWDATNNEAIYLGDERHGLTMDGVTHHYLHDTTGTRFESGLNLASFDSDGSGNDATAAQFGYAAGMIWDDDIQHTISADAAPAQIPIYYKLNADGDWRKTTLSDYPLVHGADYAGTRAAWNEFTGGAWQLTEVANLKYVLTHYFATNDMNKPIIGVCGQAAYNTTGAAREGATTELNTLITTGLPFQEFKSIATVIFQTGTSYSNTPKARVRTTDTGDDYIDWRFSAGASSAGSQINDHSQLTGLSNDDHTQYSLVDGTRAYTGTVEVSGSLSVDGNIRTNANAYINYTGPEGDGIIYFYDGGSPTGVHLKWDNALGAFYTNKGLVVQNDMRVSLATGATLNKGLEIDGQNGGYFRMWNGTSTSNEFIAAIQGKSTQTTANVPGIIMIAPTPIENLNNPSLLFRGSNVTYTGQSTTSDLLWIQNYTSTKVKIDKDGNVKTFANLYVNFGGGDGDSFLYFYEGASQTGAYLKWDDGDSRFEFSGDVYSVGGLYANGATLTATLNMSVNQINNLAEPSGSFDAVTKSYVDTVSGSIGQDLNHQILDARAYTDTTSGSIGSNLESNYATKTYVNTISGSIGQDLNHQVSEVRIYTDTVSGSIGSNLESNYATKNYVDATSGSIGSNLESNYATKNYVNTVSGSIGNDLNDQVHKTREYVDTVSGSIGQDLNHQILDAKAYTDTTSGSIGQDLNHQVLELYDYVGTVSGSATQSLQRVTDIGNTTTNEIIAATLSSNGNVSLNYDGPDGDSFLYFYENSSATGAYLQWDNALGAFYTNKGLVVQNDMRVSLATGATLNKGLEIDGQNGGYFRMWNGTSTSNEFLAVMSGKSTQTAANVAGLFILGRPPVDHLNNPSFIFRGSNVAYSGQSTTSDLLWIQNYTSTKVKIDKDGNIKTYANFYANFAGADGDSFLYFYEGGSATGAYLKWDDGDDDFILSDGLQINGTTRIKSTDEDYTNAGWGKALEFENADCLMFKKSSATSHGIGATGDVLYFMRSTADGASAAPSYWCQVTATAIQFREAITIEAGNDLTMNGNLISPPSTQNLTANSDTITVARRYHRITMTGSRDLTSTPEIAAGTQGQELILENADGVDTLTLNDEDSSGGSGLHLGAASRALGPGDIIHFIFDGTYWREISFTNL